MRNIEAAIKRITEMEAILNEAHKLLDDAKENPAALLDFQPEIKKLDAYYSGQDWKRDFALDEEGLLPGDLRRGVLSEDGIYDVLERNSDLLKELTEAGTSITKGGESMATSKKPADKSATAKKVAKTVAAAAAAKALSDKASAKKTTAKASSSKTAAKSSSKAAAAKKTAAKASSTTAAKKPAAKASSKTAAKKTSTAKKPAAKKTSTTAKKTAASEKLTATEKNLLELYRAADADTKKAAIALLKGEKSQLGGILDSILENKAIMNTVSSLFKQ